MESETSRNSKLPTAETVQLVEKNVLTKVLFDVTTDVCKVNTEVSINVFPEETVVDAPFIMEKYDAAPPIRMSKTKLITTRASCEIFILNLRYLELKTSNI